MFGDFAAIGAAQSGLLDAHSVVFRFRPVGVNGEPEDKAVSYACTLPGVTVWRLARDLAEIVGVPVGDERPAMCDVGPLFHRVIPAHILSVRFVFNPRVTVEEDDMLYYEEVVRPAVVRCVRAYAAHRDEVTRFVESYVSLAEQPGHGGV